MRENSNRKATRLLVIVGILLIIQLFFEEFSYEMNVKNSYDATLYSLTLMDEKYSLQKELDFRVTFDGLCVRGVRRDISVEGNMSFILNGDSTNLRLVSDSLVNIPSDNSWRAIVQFKPRYFGWYPYSIKKIYYTKDFSLIIIPFYEQFKLVVLSTRGDKMDLLGEIPDTELYMEFRGAMEQNRDSFE